MTGYAKTEVPGIAVKVSLEWAELGRHIADANSEDQAQFLEAWASAMHTWEALPAEMQMQFVADEVNNLDNDYEVDHMRWLLAGLLERLDS